MIQGIFTKSLILLLFISMMTSTGSGQALDVDVSPTSFSLEQDDVIAYTIVAATTGGEPGLVVELRTFEQDMEFNTTLNAGETVAFSIEQLPDWVANESDPVIMAGATNGGWFSLEYSAPYAAQPSFGDGPGLLSPLIPTGDTSYWSDFATAVSTDFDTINAADSFTMTFDNSTILANITWNKADGVMSHYMFDDGDFSLELTKSWSLIPSQGAIDYYTTSPVLDYRVMEAETTGYDDAFDFSTINIGEDGPLQAEGMWYVGDRVNVNLDEYRAIEDGAGYLAEFRNDHGMIAFNISIELPNENPGRNNMFLYPQFLVADDATLAGYLGVTEVMNEAYSYQMTGSEFSIEFTHENGTISATWDRDTGFLTSWRLNNSEEGQVLALEMIAGEAVEDLAPTFDHVMIGETTRYQFVKLDVNGENHLSLEEDQNTDGTGYIGQGDLVDVTAVSTSLVVDDQPPTAFYDINGTHGHQDNISIAFQYPGFDTVEADGPPLLYFHHLGGSETFFEWVETLYDATGGSYQRNATHIVMSYSDANVTFEQVFTTSDLKMVSYLYQNIAEDVLLEIIQIGTSQPVDTNQSTTTSSEQPAQLPVFDGFTIIALTAFFVAIPYLRKR